MNRVRPRTVEEIKAAEREHAVDAAAKRRIAKEAREARLNRAVRTLGRVVIAGHGFIYGQLVNDAEALCCRCQGTIHAGEFFTYERVEGSLQEKFVCVPCRPFVVRPGNRWERSS